MSRPTTRCETCGAAVRSAGAVESRCPFCKAVAVRTGGAPLKVGERGELVRRRELNLSKFTVDRRGADLSVRWRWSRARGVGMLLVAAFLTAVFYDHAEFGWRLLTDPAGRGGGSWEGIAFGLAPLAVPALLIYGAFTSLFNRTELAVRDRTLRSWHGPIPIYRGRRVPVDELRELRVKRVVHETKNAISVYYELHAVRTNGRAVKLILHKKDRRIPLAVKDLLDAHLGFAGPPAPARGRAGPDDAAGDRPRITLTCPRCGGTLDPPPERAELRCRFCGAKVPIPEAVVTSLGLAPARVHDRGRFRKTFSAHKRDGVMTFAADRDRAAGAIGLKIAAALLAIGAVGLGGVAAGAATFDWELGLISVAVAIFLLPTAAGAAVFYLSLCELWNRTTVTIDRSFVRVRHGPLPWPRPAPLPTAKVTQFVVRRDDQWSEKNDPRFELAALADYGATLVLFRKIADREALETLEHVVEARLGIVDRAVRG